FCLLAFAACNDRNNMNREGVNRMGDTSTVATNNNTMTNNRATQQRDNNRLMENKTIAQIISENDELSDFENDLNSANMMNQLKNGSYTVLAPTNEAFDDLSDQTKANWEQNNQQLNDVLENHIIEGAVTADAMIDGKQINTLRDSPLTFNVDKDGEIEVADSEVE